MNTRRRGGIALVLAVLLGGCNTAAPSTAPIVTPGAGTPAPTIAPTSSPAADVARLLAEQYGNVTSGGSTMTGTLLIGSVRATFTGTGQFNGPDSTQTLTTTVGGVDSTQKSAKVAGQRYLQVGNGPWLRNESSSGGGGSLEAELKDALDAGRDLDANAAGSGNHTIEAADQPFDPVALGFAASASGGKATYTFEAEPDGTPVSVGISATWRQTGQAAPADVSLELTLTFSDLNGNPRITAPADVWERFSSERWSYAVAHPADYDVSSDDDYDYLIGPDGSFVSIGRANNRGFGLNLLATSEVASIKNLLGTKSVTNEGITVGGLDGRLLSGKGTSRDLGGKIVFHEVIAVQGKFAYYFIWFSEVGNEAADLATFRQLLSTVSIGA